MIDISLIVLLLFLGTAARVSMFSAWHTPTSESLWGLAVGGILWLNAVCWATYLIVQPLSIPHSGAYTPFLEVDRVAFVWLAVSLLTKFGNMCSDWGYKLAERMLK